MGIIKRKKGDMDAVTVYLPRDIGDRVRVHCASQRVTVSQFVTSAITDCLSFHNTGKRWIKVYPSEVLQAVNDHYDDEWEEWSPDGGWAPWDKKHIEPYQNEYRRRSRRSVRATGTRTGTSPAPESAESSE